jgi:hypothetical protein
MSVSGLVAGFIYEFRAELIVVEEADEHSQVIQNIAQLYTTHGKTTSRPAQAITQPETIAQIGSRCLR